MSDRWCHSKTMGNSSWSLGLGWNFGSMLSDPWCDMILLKRLTRHFFRPPLGNLHKRWILQAVRLALPGRMCPEMQFQVHDRRLFVRLVLAVRHDPCEIYA